MSDRLQRFTFRAKRVLSFAQEEAERLQHSYIGTEHLLLGLIHEEESAAGRILRDLGLTYGQLEPLVVRMSGAGIRSEKSQLVLGPSARRVLEYAVTAARKWGDKQTGTRHLLYGLVSIQDGVAIEILKSLKTSPKGIKHLAASWSSKSFSLSSAPPRQFSPLMLKESFHSILLTKLIAELARTLEEPHRSDLRILIEKLLDEITAERHLQEDVKAALLEPLIAPFKADDEASNAGG